MRDKKTVKLAICGVFLALTTAMMFLATIVPGVELSILAVTSVISAFVIIEAGVKYGIGFYAAACIIGFLIVPNKPAVLPYIMFFGIYPVVKYLAEKQQKPWIQIIIKLSFFIFILLIAYFMLFEIFFGNIIIPAGVPAMIIIPAAIVMFLLLDYILTIIINIYFIKVHSKF